MKIFLVTEIIDNQTKPLKKFRVKNQLMNYYHLKKKLKFEWLKF